MVNWSCLLGIHDWKLVNTEYFNQSYSPFCIPYKPSMESPDSCEHYRCSRCDAKGKKFIGGFSPFRFSGEHIETDSTGIIPLGIWIIVLIVVVGFYVVIWGAI